jgi:ABC-type multidrug transport system fused ATPase/permease subunit
MQLKKLEGIDVPDTPAAKPAGKKEKPRDKKIEHDANKLLFEFLWEQKWLITLGMPFMFLGSMVNFLFPNFIGQTITALTKGEYDKVNEYIWKFVVIIVATAIASFINNYIFAYASEALGMSLRQRLYDNVIRKDISFFDDNRTGDILSRLGSDT